MVLSSSGGGILTPGGYVPTSNFVGLKSRMLGAVGLIALTVLVTVLSGSTAATARERVSSSDTRIWVPMARME